MKIEFAFTLLLLAASGCGILEEDISSRRVEIIAPADGVTLSAGAVDFRWRQTPHATGYLFSLVSPSFDAAERIVADTVIYADSLSRHYGVLVTLEQGAYEWSVEAFNGGYTGEREIRRLTVAETENPES